jgi:hypothetical protein
MTNLDAFTFRRVGTTGHEILASDGNVVAWAVDERWALIIAGLLNRVEAEGLGYGSPERPCAHTNWSCHEQGMAHE